ncbi:MAG: hypothetical protein QM791_07845 [Ferruginibacter sp.]
MKKISLFSGLMICCSVSFCQKVGIGTTTPQTTLHILSATDSTLLTLESSTALAADKSMGMLFKKGNFYVAGIRSTGTSATAARLGFFTMSPGFGPAEMTERLTIGNTGNVGIGTTTPSALLHVGNYNGNKTTALAISTEGAYSSTTGDRYALLKLRHATDNWGFSLESHDAPTASGLSFKTHNNDSAGVTRMYIDRTSGNVGIGTTSPAALLHVGNYNGNKISTFTISTEGAYSSTTGDRYALLKLRHATDNWGFSLESYDGPATAGLSFKTHSGDSAGVTRMYIDRNSGNVGIGFTNPTSKFAVNGVGYFLNSTETASPAVRAVSTVDNRFAPGVTGTGASIGVLANSNSAAGIGLFGYNNLSNATITFIGGAGVNGFSSAGHGVAGATVKTGSAAIYGTSSTQGAYGGQFIGTGGALALLTVGSVRLTGISEGAGKVLTSDASGNATWQTPAVSGTANNVSFSAHLTNSFIDVASGSTNTLSGLTTDYQLGEGFNSAEGLFIAPADGIYQFTFSISFLVRDNNPFYSTVALKVNGSTVAGGEFNDVTPSFNNPLYKTLNYTKTMNLSVGSNVALTYKIAQEASNAIVIAGGTGNTSSFFSGIKLQ